MIRAFIGTDQVKRDSALDAAIQEWLGERSTDPLSKETINIEEESEPAARVSELCYSSSLFSERRVVILQSCEKLKKDDSTGIAEYCKAPDEDTALLITGNKLDKRTPLGKFLSSNKWIVDCTAPKDYEVPKWIKNRMQERFQRNISIADANMIADLANTGLSALDMELEKLHLFAADQNITPEMILKIVSPQREHTTYELQDAFGFRNTKKTAIILHELLHESERPPFFFIQMLYSHVQNLIVAKQMIAQKLSPAEIAKQLKMHPYLYSNIRNIPKQATTRPLFLFCRILVRLSEIEAEMKLGMHTQVHEIEALLYPMFHSK